MGKWILGHKCMGNGYEKVKNHSHSVGINSTVIVYFVIVKKKLMNE